MAILIRVSGEIKNEYPNNRKTFTSREVSALLLGVRKGTVEAIVLEKFEKPTLTIWFDADAEQKKLQLNNEATEICVIYNGRSVKGDILIEGDVQLILSATHLNTSSVNFSPLKHGKK